MHNAAFRANSLVVDCLFALAIGTLFSGIHWSLGSVKVQLADVLAILAMAVALLRGFVAPRAAIIPLFLLLLYLFYYVISALFVEPSLGISKIVQVFLVIGFLFTTFGYYRTRSTDRLLILGSCVVIAVLAATIGWHIAHGRYVMWKDLNEPKTIFSLLPLMLVLVTSRFPRSWPFPLLLVAVLSVAGLVFLSGERKAYIFFIVTLVIWSGPAKLWRYALPAAVAVPLLLVAASLDHSGYLTRQLNSFAQLVPGGSKHHSADSDAALIAMAHGTTMSNAEREFSNRMARSLWLRKPILGIGTGAFALVIRGDMSIPEEFRMGIHGEFFRTLYEDGIVGFSLYIAIWLSTFIQLALRWRLTANVDPAFNKIKLLTIVMCANYVAFEANKELTLIALCLLPFIVETVPRGRQSAPRLPVTDFQPSLAAR